MKTTTMMNKRLTVSATGAVNDHSRYVNGECISMNECQETDRPHGQS